MTDVSDSHDLPTYFFDCLLLTMRITMAIARIATAATNMMTAQTQVPTPEEEASAGFIATASPLTICSKKEKEKATIQHTCGNSLQG